MTRLLAARKPMELPFQLISTDFDGTVFSEFEHPPVPEALQNLLGWLQSHGVRWVINTGRDLSSLMEALGRAHLRVRPDYLVLVEREIYRHTGARYEGIDEWNQRCRREHEALFEKIQADLPPIVSWINENFDATVYSDSFSPFCLIANSNRDADRILARLEDYCRKVRHLTIMRNDVYARLSHEDYSKGTALAEIARRLGVGASRILAAGDHLNDLPMLMTRHARYLVAPANAVLLVQEAVRRQGGYVSPRPSGEGVCEGVERVLRAAGVGQTPVADRRGSEGT